MAQNPIKYFVVDAFTDSAFKGNPAAVVLLEQEKDEKWLRSVAAEFNIPVTCYLTRLPSSASSIPRFHIRWFTPVAEIELCGHATLAASHALFKSGEVDSNIVEFATLSGILTAKKVVGRSDTETHEGFFIELNFPTDPLTESVSAEDSILISKALGGASVVNTRITTLNKIIVVVPSAEDVAELQPDFGELKKCPGVGIVVTGIAPSESGFDFHSRFFCPKFGVNEDFVCGSAHCALAPYWSKELEKCDFVAYQSSPRGGVLKIHLDEQNERVLLQGKAVTVMEGTVLA